MKRGRGRPKIALAFPTERHPYWINRILRERRARIEKGIGRPRHGATICREPEITVPLQVITAKADTYQERARDAGKKLNRKDAIRLAVCDSLRRIISARRKYLTRRLEALEAELRDADVAGDIRSKAELTAEVEKKKAELDSFSRMDAAWAGPATIQTIIDLDRAARRACQLRTARARLLRALALLKAKKLA